MCFGPYSAAIALLTARACAQGYEEAGTDLAQALTQKDKMARAKAAMKPDVARALARLSSGLYVVTAAHTNARGAMARPRQDTHACQAGVTAHRLRPPVHFELAVSERLRCVESCRACA